VAGKNQLLIFRSGFRIPDSVSTKFQIDRFDGHAIKNPFSSDPTQALPVPQSHTNTPESRIRNPESENSRSSELHSELREFFIHLASMLSMPKSLGEIYGLLYASAEPLCFEDIQTELEISKGSTSMGLRSLREMGAIVVVNQPGDRRDFYTAEHSLRRLAEAFLSTRIRPHLENGEARIEKMEALLEDQPDDPYLHQAVGSLRTWNRKAKRLLPLIQRLIK